MDNRDESDNGFISFWSLLVRLALGFGISYLLWLWQGRLGAVDSVLLWGILLARPLVDLFAWLAYQARRSVFGPWEGTYYEYRGHPLRATRIGGQLWFVARDVYRALGHRPPSEIEDRLVAYDRRRFGLRRYFSEGGLHHWLSSDRDPAAARLLQWFETRIYPQEHRRQTWHPTPHRHA